MAAMDQDGKPPEEPRGTKARRRMRAALSFAGRLFVIPVAAAITGFAASIALLVWVLVSGQDEHPLAYGVYAASAYFLATLCVCLVRSGLVPKTAATLRDGRLGMLAPFLDDKELRIRVGVVVGLAVDVLWGAGNLAMGALVAAAWPFALGVYYLLLAAMRALVCWHLYHPSATDAAYGRRAERTCGVLLIASMLALSGIVTLSMRGDGGFSYPGFLVYAYATYAFYSLIMAIVNYVRLRSHDNRLIVVNCRINLAVALVSIFALEVALLSAFSGPEDAQVQFVMPIVTGAAIALAMIGLGIRCLRPRRPSPATCDPRPPQP